MRTPFGLRALGAATLLIPSTLVQAGPTGLLSIPVADILGHREAEIGIGATGSERRIDKGYGWNQYGQAGLFDRIEAGYDLDLLGSVAANVKVLLTEREGVGAVSAGWMNLAQGSGPSIPYLMGRADFRKLRLHAGIQHDDRWRGLFGIDAEAPGLPAVTLMADWVTGPENRVWAGANIQLPTPGLALCLAAGIPTERRLGFQHSIYLAYGFRF